MARATWWVALAALAGCLDNPYVIGRQCTVGDPDCPNPPVIDGAVDAGCAGPECALLTFDLPMSASGPGRLGEGLPFGGATLSASLWLEGRLATTSGWPATRGAAFARSGPGGDPRVSSLAPFTDGTGAVGLGPSTALYQAPDAATGDLGGGSAVLEVTFRAAPDAVVASKDHDGGAGYTVRFADDLTLRWALDDGARRLEVASSPLVAEAWHHCLLYLVRAAGAAPRARIDCNGQPGATETLTDLGALTAASALRLGGATAPPPAELSIADLRVHLASALPVDLGSFEATLDATSAARFAAVAGVAPVLAHGSSLPPASSRPSPAYLDLDEGGIRRLFLVGAHWPRVVCRTSPDGARMCGYLAEQGDSAAYGGAREPSDWDLAGLSVAAASAPSAAFPDGTARMQALVPTAATEPHTLAQSGSFGAMRHAFSFFARAGSSAFVGASAGPGGLAVFDLSAGVVVTEPDGARAAIEDWGGGLFRCVYVLDAPAGTVTHTVHALGDASGGPWAGGGEASHFVAAIQVELNRGYAGSLLPEGGRSRDRLSFRADDGNLPAGGRLRVAARVLMPAFPRLTDQAVVNLNRARSFDDQLNLFLAAPARFEFAARADAQAQWGFQHPAEVGAGRVHDIAAEVDLPVLALEVDGQRLSFQPSAPSLPDALDWIDVGFSDHASGPLEGVVGAVRIGALPE